MFFFFFFTLGTGPRRCLSLKLSDRRFYEPQIRTHLGTTAHCCQVVGAIPESRFFTLSRAVIPCVSVWAKVQGFVFRVWGSGSRVWGVGLRVWG